MRFESIKMENYRQYKDVFLTFEKNRSTDLHIIVASNGVGKTNLLNSICWCLYKKEPHLGNASESLPICNLESIKEAKNEEKKQCVVRVEIIASTESKRYQLTRSVPVNTSTLFEGKDLFKIFVTDKITGETDVLVDDVAEEKINSLLPWEIREYFFFDAEQLFNYFQPKSESTTFVKDAIHTIAQVTLVKRVSEHLNNVIKKEYKSPLEKLNPQMAEIQNEIDDTKKLKEKYLKDIEDISVSIQESKDTIEKNNRLINGVESVVEDNKKYNSNLEELDSINESRQVLMVKFQELIQKYIPLLYLYKINKSAHEFINSKKNILGPDIDPAFLIKSIREHICACCNQPLKPEKEEEMQRILDKLEWSTDVTEVLNNVKNEIRKSLDDAKNYKKEKDILMNELRSLDEKQKSLEEHNSYLYERISKYSSLDGIELLMDQREQHKGLLENNQRKIGAYEHKVEELEKDIKKLEEKYKKSLKEQKDSDVLKEKIMFAEQGLDIINEILKEMISEVREQMEIRTMELFKEFIWNDKVPFRYSKVKLTENYKLELYHVDTNTSCMGSCSATERQMLALAFTIALHQVSGYDSLLFIDTPVGRVSDINRENFARVLVNISEKKQMIFTFTPSEFSEEIQGYFNENVRSTYRALKTDNSKTMEV